MLRANIHPRVVQDRLGPSTISTTLDIYSHVTPELQDQAARTFDAMFRLNLPETLPALP